MADKISAPDAGAPPVTEAKRVVIQLDPESVTLDEAGRIRLSDARVMTAIMDSEVSPETSKLLSPELEAAGETNYGCHANYKCQVK